MCIIFNFTCFEQEMDGEKSQSQGRGESKLKSNSVSFKESLMGACTNFVYRIGALGGIKRMPHFLKKEDAKNEFVILGQTYSDQMKVKQKFLQLIWFTYREKLKLTEDLTSDVGWGCLPRVGQMLLAEALLKFFLLRGEKLNKQLYKKVILPFIDQDEEAKYSLSTILKYARWKFSINPGEWFKIGQISDVLKKLQNEDPMPGSQNMKIVFFHQSVIFLDEVYSRAKVIRCTCQSEEQICKICHKEYKVVEMGRKQSCNTSEEQVLEFQGEEEEETGEGTNQRKRGSRDSAKEKEKRSEKEESYKEEHRFQKDILMIVLVRVDQKEIDNVHYDCILSLLNEPTSLGIIGGVPSKALYIVGYAKNELIYLDPHFVQEQTDIKEFDESLITFFCPSFRTINKEAIDPSMAFCFYLRSLEEMKGLKDKINSMNKELEEQNKSAFIFCMKSESLEKEEKRKEKKVGESPPANSCEYSSLEFRDITDSY